MLCLSSLEYWLFHRGAWFVSLILVLYLLSPLLYHLLNGRNRWSVAIIIILVLSVLSNKHIDQTSSTSVLVNVQSAFSRVPCFVLGMAVAQDCMNKKTISSIWIFVLAAWGIVIHKIAGLNLGMAWTIIPLIIFIILVVMKTLCKVGLIDGALQFLGKISLESYLTNITINSALCAIIPTYISSPIFYGRWFEYSIVIIIGLLSAYEVHKLNFSIR